MKVSVSIFMFDEDDALLSPRENCIPGTRAERWRVRAPGRTTVSWVRREKQP